MPYTEARLGRLGSINYWKIKSTTTKIDTFASVLSLCPNWVNVRSPVDRSVRGDRKTKSISIIQRKRVFAMIIQIIYFLYISERTNICPCCIR